MIVLGKDQQITPREASSTILTDYISHSYNLKNTINQYFDSSDFDSRDRRFINEIVMGTVRYLIRIDYLISHFSRIKIKKIDPEVLNILRTAFYQFLFMSRIPGYSIVNESVKIVKKFAGQRSAGFVNALLRNISKIKGLPEYADKEIEGSTKDFREKMVLKYSFPFWLVDYWTSEYGKEKTERLLLSLNRPSFNFMRINSLKTRKRDQVRLLIENGFIPGEDFEELSGDKVQEKIFSDTITVRSLQNVVSIPGYADGFFSIQDFSSQFAVKDILKPQPGEKILDLCGAPGGKATYISELTGDTCMVVSVDINKDRIETYKKNIERLGINDIQIIRSDVTKKNYIDHRNHFDKVFIDCPCSAFGTISKNPDVKYNKTIEDVKRLSGQSLDILSNCVEYLKPGGKIVFYTCTLSRIENQEVIRKFIEAHKDIFTLKRLSLPEPVIKYLNKSNIDLSNEKDFLEIMPYFFKSEGGFVADIYKKQNW